MLDILMSSRLATLSDSELVQVMAEHVALGDSDDEESP
jgi:hypothetical protein